jgi:hypothetical protein
LVEEASLDRDLSIVAGGKFDLHVSPTDPDELDTFQLSVRRTPNPFRHFQSSQKGPAGRVQAIAANLLAREFLALDDCGSQTGGRAKCTAA